MIDNAFFLLSLFKHKQLHGASNEARILTSLNLAIVYLRNKRENELNELLVNLNPESLHSKFV